MPRNRGNFGAVLLKYRRQPWNNTLYNLQFGGIHMRKQNKKHEELMKKVIKHVIDAEAYGWPPQCVSFLYQPIRPQAVETRKSCTKGEEQQKH